MIYSPQQFTISDRDLLFRVMRENSFATLIAASGEDPWVAHVPVIADPENNLLHAHVARANPIWHQFAKPRKALFIFHGPHHYISPSWYTVHPSVPTWNYVVVHVSGVPMIVEDRAIIETMLGRLVEQHEAVSEAPWSMDLPADYLQKMIDGIVAFQVPIDRIEGKFKLSQNRPRVDQSNVIAALEKTGSETAARVAALMGQVLKP